MRTHSKSRREWAGQSRFAAAGVALLTLTGCSATSNAAPESIDEPTIVGELPGAASEPSASAVSSAGEVASGNVSGSDDERMWEVCYAPLNSVGQVTSNPNIINKVLDDYPAEWRAVAPVPATPVPGVCHQTIPTAGSQNSWWIHFADENAGYEAALAWRDQLVSVGAAGGCVEGFDLGQGPGVRFSCSYALPNGWGAGILNPFGPVDLQIQEPMK